MEYYVSARNEDVPWQPSIGSLMYFAEQTHCEVAVSLPQTQTEHESSAYSVAGHPLGTRAHGTA
jgi:hypothetical protein